jgi:hypothetical protein
MPPAINVPPTQQVVVKGSRGKAAIPVMVAGEQGAWRGNE